MSSSSSKWIENRGRHLEGRLFVGPPCFTVRLTKAISSKVYCLSAARVTGVSVKSERSLPAMVKRTFARFDIDRQVVDPQAAGFDDEPVVEGMPLYISSSFAS